MTTTQKQYNYCLDFLKGIACIFVVFMHCEFPGLMGTAVQAISRFCVPFFFMVSGYFCFKPLIPGERSSISKKLLHIGKITLFASLVYLVFVLLQQLAFHNQSLVFSRRDLFNWVVFNKPKIIAGQYWFLFALLYAYAFYGIFERMGLRRLEYVLAAILFLAYIIMAQGSWLAGITVDKLMYRNWLVEAFPYFMLGHWIHEHQEKIRISNKTLLIIIIITTLLCWVERWIMGRDFGVNIVTIPQVFALFMYGVKNPTRHEGVMQRFGRDCSMLVYILHPVVWHSLDGVFSVVGVSGNMLVLYLRPLLVLGISILLSLLFNFIVMKVQKRKVATQSI